MSAADVGEGGDTLARQPVGQLAPQAWLAWPETIAVLDALGGAARFVGGCVRDAILRRPVKDIDLATPLLPEAVIAALETAGLKAVPTGLAHGTVTAVSGGRPFEITTLRRDVACDGRHAQVEFTDNWRQDAARRDFTFNALYADHEGNVYDYHGGIHDLAEGRVRFIGRALARIEEDGLRILRFFRFLATHGRLPVDQDGLSACAARATMLASISAERIRDELLKILTATDPMDVLLLMRGTHVLEQVLPEVGGMDRMRSLVFLETHAMRPGAVGPDPLRRLACLLPEDADGEAVGMRLRLSRRGIDRLAGLTGPAHPRLTPDLDTAARHRMLNELGRERFIDLALLRWAAERAPDPAHPAHKSGAWIELVEQVLAFERPDFPLRGADLAGLGMAPGPAMGALLAALETWWAEGGFAADRTSLLDEARRRLAQPGS